MAGQAGGSSQTQQESRLWKMVDAPKAGERTTGGASAVFFGCVQGEKRKQDDSLPERRIWSPRALLSL